MRGAGFVLIPVRGKPRGKRHLIHPWAQCLYSICLPLGTTQGEVRFNLDDPDDMDAFESPDGTIVIEQEVMCQLCKCNLVSGYRHATSEQWEIWGARHDRH